MQLPSQHRREIIEDLLDIQIFSTMNILLKDKINNNKTDITDIKYKIELLNNNIESAQSHNESIRRIKETEVSKIKEKIKDRVSYIEDQNNEIESVNTTIDKLLETIQDESDVKQKLQKVVDVVNKLNIKQSQLLKEVSFYENHDSCPTCKQGIDHEFKDGTITEHKHKVGQIVDGQSELTVKINGFESRLKEIESVKNTIAAENLKASEHRANVKLAMSVLKGLKAELESAEEEVEAIDTSKIEDLQIQLGLCQAKQSELSQDRETLSIVSSMLKDGGIKTRIIKQYVPVMNKLINKYLSAMDFFVQFELNENFEETIKSRFRDVFSYGSFSEGEKLRIDLALLFTWRAVSKLRNSVTTNILIMDEIMDSSLDNAGTEEFLKIINELTSDSNVFIISHKGDQLYDKFDNIIKFEKYQNFSRMVA
jgi:DNA repair exonuclease SbcCD ATPase subunit